MPAHSTALVTNSTSAVQIQTDPLKQTKDYKEPTPNKRSVASYYETAQARIYFASSLIRIPVTYFTTNSFLLCLRRLSILAFIVFSST